MNTAKRKIARVLYRIKEQAELNPDPRWMEFEFHDDVVVGGYDYPSAKEERRILLKLKHRGAIRLHLPDHHESMDQEYIQSFDPEEFMEHGNSKIVVEMRFVFPIFYRYYAAFFSGLSCWWDVVNPFWLCWKILETIFLMIRYVFRLTVRNKVVSLLASLITALLAYDYSMAWRNLDAIQIYLGFK